MTSLCWLFFLPREEVFGLVEKADLLTRILLAKPMLVYLFIVVMVFIAGTATADVMRFFFGQPGCCLWYYIGIVGSAASSADALSANVARSTAACRIDTIALITDWTFAYDFAICVRCIVCYNVCGTWSTQLTISGAMRR